MESLVLEEAFSMWKMFNEIVNTLLKPGSIESSTIQKLANMVMSKEFSKTFIYNKEPGIQFKEYIEIVKKYHFFTTWLLGQFFYLLNCDDDKLIVDAQLSIIDQLSRTQLHTYSDLANEYCKAFDLLVVYVKEPSQKRLIKVFIPEKNKELDEKLNLKPTFIEIVSKEMCLKLLKKLLRILNYILGESVIFYSVETSTYVMLDNLLYLLCHGYFQLEIFEIFIDIVERINCHINDWNVRFITKIRSFFSLFEQFVYDFYNKNSNEVNSEIFQTLFVKYLRSCIELKADIGQHSDRLVAFVIKISLNKTRVKHLMPLVEVQKMCVQCFCQPLSSIFNNIEETINCIIDQHNSTMFRCLHSDIFKDICDYVEVKTQVKEIKVFEDSVSPKWSTFYHIFINKLKNLLCNEEECEMQQTIIFLTEIVNILLEMYVKFRRKYGTDCILIFLNENDLLPQVLSTFCQHYTSCNNLINTLSLLRLMANQMIVSNPKNIDIVYHLISCQFLVPMCYKSESQLPSNFIGNVDKAKFRSDLKNTYLFILRDKKVKKEDNLVILNRFFALISSGLLSNLNQTHIEQIEVMHGKILRQLQDSEDVIVCQVVENTPNIMNIFSDTNGILTNVLVPLFSKSNKIVLKKVLEVLPDILCPSMNDFVKIINSESVKICCEKCRLKGDSKNRIESIEAYLEDDPNACGIIFSKNRLDLSSLTSTFLKFVINSLISSNVDLKVKALETLPCLSQHITKFYSPDVTKIWIELSGDPRVEVRNKLAEVLGDIVSNGQSNHVISEATKVKVLEIIASVLLRLTKKSLQYSEYDLQDTLVTTVGEIVSIDNDRLKLDCMKILLYLIMVPSSSVSFLAVSESLRLSKKDASGRMSLYKQYTEEICEIIVHLCYVNQHLISCSLQESLFKVSALLGFDGVKDFVTKESEHLLPFFIAKVVTNPNVSTLISEMATLIEVDISELLSRKYGKIFLHLFLGSMDRNEAKQCLGYLEKTTKLSGPKLRKLNFKVILNELLLNFHEKRENVLTILKLLLQEDSSTQATSIEDYLQPFFLAFLLYFDLELTSEYSKKEKILLSLADLFKFMGPNRITPLRFKIIAMLQTTHYLKHPELSCEVWNAFIQSCEIECLGPHLATIFISMLPLMQHNPNINKVNKIFHYLIVENEKHLQEYISDLFFVSNTFLATTVISTIKKHLQNIEEYSLKNKIKRYLKYLKHDTLEVRIQSLKQLKTCLEQNREELDQMILGYNGMDSTIVELIENLTLGSREKDETLKLACGEIFGELGAIEPSHLPRRYAQDNKSFTFFISEDPFIEGALNELIKAFQTDKNARNTDRVALAIQELLKTFEISPNELSARNTMWKKFPEWQREVMVPLLSSKYICVENFTVYPCPLYGSSVGASFQAWLYNWTSSLISTLPEERRSLLQSCFPSMKLDKRVLMHFLPYILLHSLMEGNNDNIDKSYTEFETILSSFNRPRTIDEKVLGIRPLPIPGLTPIAREVTAEEEKQMQCTKVVFVLLDFLDRWLREWHWHKGQSAGTDRNYQIVKSFLKRFCKLELARCNYKCGEYPRSLMYLEDYINDNPDEISGNLPFLTEIYAQLDESDGALRVESLQQSEPSMEQRLLSLAVTGKLADAAAIYEHMPRPLKLQHIQGLIQCYLDLDQVNTALYFAEGALDLQSEFGNSLLEMQAEPLWRLGKYDDLEKMLMKPEIVDNKSWGVQLGRSLVHIKKAERDEFKSVLESIKKQQVDLFSAASLKEGAYQHGYSCITRLHCLNELEQLEKTLFNLFIKPNDKNYAKTIMRKLMSEWQLRIKVVQESVRIIEPLLCLRRVALNLGREIAEVKAPQAVPFFDSLLGECWLQSVTIARNAGAHQQAYTYILDAEKYAPPKLFLEKAKLHWLREEHEEALITLKRGLNFYIPDNASSQDSQLVIATLGIEKKQICAEARLLVATYNDAICSVDYDMNLLQYKDSVDVYKEWEKSLVCLAQYQNRKLQSLSDEEKDKKTELQLHVVNNFAKSLTYGTNYVYQSMPHLLSVWFDYGTRLLDFTNSNSKEERRNTLCKMTKIIDGFLTKLPPFIFLTSFSQIISRISHPQKEVYVQVKEIIVKLLQHYPQQCLWMISSVIKSSYPIRAKRCAEILTDPRLKTQAMMKLFKDFTSLAEKLIELCNKEIPQDVHNTTVSFLVRALPRMLNKGDFSEIMMPTHKFRKLILPNPDFKNSQHNPFPNHYVHIVGIEDDIVVLTSLQRPRKIKLRGSDGKHYTFMLKPKDDLRKDFRLMEFNDIVNHLLLRDAEARQRRLNIRLYSVAPLNEECGLIEWVPDLLGLRPVLMNLYKQRGLGMRPREIKEACSSVRDPLSKKRDIFIKILLKKHPPVLGEWFKKTFPDAQTWLTARTGYIRTTAVMSIAGYILGLGDRHGENILLDSTCGDVVHVDFNCLFNKGETFEWPERVPFRLTQNMVSAMGPLGVEGVFRKSCEFTLRVLRSNTPTLMSIVTPFVYDPLVSWPRNVPAAAQSSERVNEQALEHIKNIELRLQGKVKMSNRTMSQYLSVEGQTDYLIKEAISVDNLCQMYIGWGPYL